MHSSSAWVQLPLALFCMWVGNPTFSFRIPKPSDLGIYILIYSNYRCISWIYTSNYRCISCNSRYLPVIEVVIPYKLHKITGGYLQNQSYVYTSDIEVYTYLCINERTKFVFKNPHNQAWLEGCVTSELIFLFMFYLFISKRINFPIVH